jgi:hypothetical protein
MDELTSDRYKPEIYNRHEDLLPKIFRQKTLEIKQHKFEEQTRRADQITETVAIDSILQDIGRIETIFKFNKPKVISGELKEAQRRVR